MCKYYPCHKEEKLESCLFCYCPVYPCYIAKTGGKYTQTYSDNQVWDCSDCTIIHNKKVVENIKKYIIKQLEKI